MRLPSDYLKGRVAIVSGASRGIGRRVVVALAACGARVVAVSRTGLGVATNRRKPRGVVEVRGDITQLDTANAALAAALSAFGRIDIVVNNAGVARRGALVDTTPQAFAEVMAVNVTGPFFLSQAAARAMMEARRGGVIINVASVLGLVGAADMVAYTASKHALIGMTRALALELAPHDIRVQALALGFTAAGMNEGLLADPPRHTATKELIPMRRLAQVEEIATLVTLLCGSYASYMTGDVVVADGGLLAGVALPPKSTRG